MAEEQDRIRELKYSVEMEARADLYAAARDLGSATHYMHEVNAIRSRIFGKLEPSDLRERTTDYLAATKENDRG